MRKMSKEEFLEILSRQQRSGLTIKDFCVNAAYTESLLLERKVWSLMTLSCGKILFRRDSNRVSGWHNSPLQWYG